MIPARRVITAGTAATAALLILMVTAGPAAAHLAIRLDIRAPEDGSKVGPRTELEVYAQPTLAGVDHTTYRVILDGKSIDPATGKPTSNDTVTNIEVSTSRRTPLVLTPGSHHLAVEYRPDIDEPVRDVSIDFTVRTTKSTRWADALIAGAVIVAAATFVAVRRVRRAHPEV
jgi:hypothetical protein